MISTSSRSYSPRPGRLLYLLPFICLLLLTLFTTEALAAITITPTSASPTSPVFLTDAGNGAKCNYVSFNATTDTDVDDVWLKIDTFSGPLSLGGGDDGTSHFGPMAAGETRAAFFFVCSTFAGSGNNNTSFPAKFASKFISLDVAKSAAAFMFNPSVIINPL